MSIEKAWSSERGSIIAYLISDREGLHIKVNNDGELITMYGTMEELDVKFAYFMDGCDARHESLIEVELWPEGKQLYVKAQAHNRASRTFCVTVKGTLLNLGANPHGIDQLVTATHTVEEIHSLEVHQVNIMPLEEQVPMLLRNGAQLIGLVQGWIMSAETSDKL